MILPLDGGRVCPQVCIAGTKGVGRVCPQRAVNVKPALVPPRA